MTTRLGMAELERELLATGTTLLATTAEEQAAVRAAFNAFDGGFAATPDTAEVIRIISGHINNTYCVMEAASGRKFIVQKLNTIFDIAAIDNNLQRLEEAQVLRRDRLPAWWQPVHYLNVAGQAGKIFYDAGGAGWRVMHFVPGDIRIFNTFSQVPAAQQAAVARSQGEAIAIFGDMLDAFPADAWQEPLPNFHNGQYHLDYLHAILSGEDVVLSLSRDTSRRVTLDRTMRMRYACRTETLLAKVAAHAGLLTALDHLGKTVAHGDTKLNNFVFRRDGDSWRAVCLIDLDTVQRGNMLDDLGDALRYAGNPAGEEPASPDDVRIDETVVANIVDGYAGEMTARYGPERGALLRDNALRAFALFLYQQCLRFFADSLAGNAYWKLKPGMAEDINLYRGEVQMHALEQLERLM